MKTYYYRSVAQTPGDSFRSTIVGGVILNEETTRIYAY